MRRPSNQDRNFKARTRYDCECGNIVETANPNPYCPKCGATLKPNRDVKHFGGGSAFGIPKNTGIDEDEE
jgi:hypothetical protein